MVRLLIDGDLVVYRAAAAVQVAVPWDGPDDPDPQILADEDEAWGLVLDALEDYGRALGRGERRIALSSQENFRKQLDPTYKANRRDRVHPVLLERLKARAVAELDALVVPRLEADDVLGLWATGPAGGILVSTDKDFATIPGRWWNPGRPERGVVETTPEDAFRAHMLQTLTGDSADGYPGCPGIGPVKAGRILDERVGAPGGAPFDLAWRIRCWCAVRNAYAKRGLTEADALRQARLARILQAGDFNPETGGVRLWQAPVKR